MNHQHQSDDEDDLLNNRQLNRLPRPCTPPGIPASLNRQREKKLSFGVVCSSNINRSMEAHVVLGNVGLNVECEFSCLYLCFPMKVIPYMHSIFLK